MRFRILLLLLLPCGAATAQLSLPPVAAPALPGVQMWAPSPDAPAAAVPSPAPLPLIQTHSAFFCRLELRIERSARIPFRFRLGDVHYNDYLEGKKPDYRY